MSSVLANAIAGLGSGEAALRESAASEVYAEGRRLAAAAVQNWWTDEELSELMLGQKREMTVGLAVQRETFVKIRTANGVSRMAEVPSEQDAEEFELHFSGGAALDILTSRAPGGDGSIARYLGKFGEGVQQVEFRCLNVERATEILKEKFKVSAVYPETRAGADATRVNFFLVPATGSGKVLIELFESSGKPHKK
ncbi:MAG TPA: hypothetical protein VMI32_20370 [Candidatus Solibacter sp.]|nr:hypothetical protein [Candidatus Solibacter sp.]